MLQYLHIDNIAVIEKANIEFGKSFNVLTGETGAGKSIIIDSLYAVLGERTSRELIRHGSDNASVTASFTGLNSSALGELEKLGISYCTDDELIISRTITSDGRSKARINMQPISISALKELGHFLINIHGQFDSQGLLNPDRHIDFVDAFADNQNLLTDYRECFNKLRTADKELENLISAEEDKNKRLSLLKYQVDEISSAEIKPGEIESLNAYLIAQNSSQRLLDTLNISLNELSGDGESDELSAIDKLRISGKNIETVSQLLPEIKQLYDRLSSVVYEAEDISSSISALISANQYDPEQALKSTERLEYLKDIVLKYGGSEDSALAYLEKASSDIENIRNDSKQKSELEKILENAEKELIEAGKRLSDSRKKAADEICKKITAELSYLDFKSSVFIADCKIGRYTKNGCDTIQFLISANAGEEPKPLAKVASGGELSRIMLAIRSVLSMTDDVDTLVFDEIDTGISGHAAVKVAEKLHSVSENKQVICVTHLAQLASKADTHLLISKAVKNDRTFTEVTPLNGENRVMEIARIMSGDNYSETILASAREMLYK